MLDLDELARLDRELARLIAASRKGAK